MEVCDRGNSLENKRDRLMFTRAGTRTNYLVFRTFGVEDGEKELAVTILTFGELEGSQDLSERWRGCLEWVKGQHAGGQRGAGRRTCSRVLQEESTRCWAWAVEFMCGEVRRWMGEEAGRYTEWLDSKYKYAK